MQILEITVGDSVQVLEIASSDVIQVPIETNIEIVEVAKQGVPGRDGESARLVTHKLDLDDDGAFVLPTVPLGGLVWDMAHIEMLDGTFETVTEVFVVVSDDVAIGSVLFGDWALLRDGATSILVSYLESYPK